MTASAHRSMSRTAVCAEKSQLSAVCGEILAPAAFTAPETDEGPAVGLRTMNMLRIPNVLPTPSRRHTPEGDRVSRKRRDTAQGARLELTLEAPSRAPAVEENMDEPPSEPERGIAEVDFYI
ncbi:MAG: hypothetical protein KUG77_24435 [Nannocystaceae bacterium]|nr:hypothetical protein [Nannocystaceae bacterium]